jgi:hypothetical protein
MAEKPEGAMDRDRLDPLRRRILDLMESRGISLRGASEELGRNPAYLHQFLFKASPKSLREAERVKLAGLLGVSEALLMSDDQRSVAEFLRRPLARMAGGPKLLIVKYSRGGSDCMTINEDAPMGDVDRPASLIGVDDAYAIEIVGESHEDRLRAGDVAHVHPHKALTRGCDCVVQMMDGSAIVALFQRMDADRLYVDKLTRRSNEVFLRSCVKAVHRIVGANFKG